MTPNTEKLKQSAVIENTDSLKAENRLLHYLIGLAYALSQQNEMSEIFRVVGQKSATLLNAEIALILMINPRTHQTVKTVYEEVPEEIHSRLGVLQSQVTGWIIRKNQPLLSRDMTEDSRFINVEFDRNAVKSVIGVPLRVEGVIIGSLVLLNKNNQEEFDEDDLDQLDRIAVIAAPYLRNVQRVQDYFEKPVPQNALLAKYKELGLLGGCQRFIAMLQAIEAAARCHVRVILEGQSGTGKELVARAIHKISARGDRPFIAIDCGAIPQNLLESELFGHKRGAFTGAMIDRKGLIAEANHGTLFMDEIENLPWEMQAKLMRVLQEGEVRPVGSNETRTVDVRFISASSTSLKALVEKQQFREDLYYRLHVYPISVPTLDERQEDILLLANHFLEKSAQQRGISALSFHEELLDFMQQRPWQGNIRELENFVERLVTLAAPGTKSLDHTVLPPDLLDEFHEYKVRYAAPIAKKSLQDYLTEYEEKTIRQFLTEYHWNQSRAAKALKISERMMRYRMSKLGIKKPS